MNALETARIPAKLLRRPDHRKTSPTHNPPTWPAGEAGFWANLFKEGHWLVPCVKKKKLSRIWQLEIHLEEINSHHPYTADLSHFLNLLLAT